MDHHSTIGDSALIRQMPGRFRLYLSENINFSAIVQERINDAEFVNQEIVDQSSNTANKNSPPIEISSEEPCPKLENELTESEFDQPQNSPSVKELPSSESSESVEVMDTPEQPIEISPATTPTVEIIDLDTPEIEENIDIEATEPKPGVIEPENEPERKYIEEVEDYSGETFTEETTPSSAPSPVRTNSNGGNEG